MKLSSRRFVERYRGADAHEAFRVGSRVSRSAHGMGKGNLCDKSSFITIESASRVIHDDDVWLQSLPPAVFDLWGPAGCINLGGGNYIFFGYSPVDD